MDWMWDEKSQTYFYGTEKHGCGVYEENGKWCGNVSAYGQIIMVGEKPSQLEAQKSCIEQLKALEDTWGG